jgi:lipoprotein-anchoring transpeptidase ErfK/SrfK
VKGEVVTTEKRIVVNLSEEMLYAYDGDVLFMQEPISTGLNITPTPLGTFTVYAMTPSRYMQGPLPGVSDQVYDLPGVPWNLYFTTDGAVIHGAYWHNKFGQPWSHGCVNLPPDKAKELYLWSDIGMKVTVEN